MFRYAIYYAPRPDEALARVARAWLGRDPEAGGSVTPSRLSGLSPERQAEITADPRRYGFHGTLKAPFRLVPVVHETEFLSAVAAFASDRAEVRLDGLKLAEMDGFLALVPRSPSRELGDLAADCVRLFDRFRAPPTTEELTRRRAGRLSPRQDELLESWGYPFVLDEFRFHLTLTGRLDDAERDLVRRGLEELTIPFRDVALPIRDLVVFVQDDPDSSFRVLARYPLLGG